MTAAPYLIVVDDEEDLREPVAAYLNDQGLDVDDVGSGSALDGLLARRTPALVILDVTMPDEDGFSIARRLRAAHPAIGIVMLTARRDVIDRVVGLEVGADDYLMKPFDPRELLARIRAVLRRLHAPPPVAPAFVEPDGASEANVRGAEPVAYEREFWIPTTQGQIRVPVETIEWIEAAKDYALLHTPERSHMLRITMQTLEQALDPAEMVRVHRSTFVRPGAVLHIRELGRHMALILRSGKAVRVGPRYWNEVRNRL
jgi:two-component system response regulator AlgR